MERFRQRIMKDLLELEEAAALKVKPKKIISEEGNVKTIDCEGDLAVLLSTPLLQSFIGYFNKIQSSYSQLAGFPNWDHVTYNDLIQIFPTDNEKFSECSLQLKASSTAEDEVESLVVFASALAVYSICVSKNSHLQHISSQIQSDVIAWTSKIFRFSADRGFVIDSSTTGLVKICHLVIRKRYPLFSELGYEVLQRMSPVIYIGRSSSASQLLHSLCSQLLLPVSCVCLVETEMSYDFSEAMDLTVLQTHIARHKAENKVPLLLIAYAGSSCMGQVDHLTELREICDKHGIWLHVEGNDLSTLSYLNVPINIVSSRLADSLTLAVGPWLGLPCLPSLTLYKSEKKQMKSSEVQNTEEADKEEEEMSNGEDVLTRCLPLWFVLQHLGHDGITKRIEYAFSLAKRFTEELQKISSIFILKKLKKDVVNSTEDKSLLKMGLSEKIMNAIKSLIIQHLDNPSVVFYYHYKKDKQCSEMNSYCKDQLLMEGANKWMAAEVLATFQSRGHCPVSVVEIEKIGVCMRYCSLEMDQVGRCNKTEFEECIQCLDEKSKALDFIFEHKQHLNVDLECHQNLRLVSCTTWDGVGSVRFVPEQQFIVNEMEEKTSLADLERRVDEINCEIHKFVCSADQTSCSLGETSEGNQCIKLGIVPDCEHLRRLLQSISQAGNIVKMGLNRWTLVGS